MSFRRRCADFVAPVVVLAIALPLAAAPVRTARLSYSRGADASDCPDSDVVHAGVAARLGYEPFDDRGEVAVSATVSRVGRRLEARIKITDATGKTTAERKLSSRQSDCSELASAMELAISIAIDPLVGNRPKPDPPAPLPSPPVPPAPAQPPTVIIVREQAPPPPVQSKVEAPPTVPTTFQVRLGGLGAVGSAPAAVVGGMVQASARRGSFSVALEGRGDLPSSTELYAGPMRVGEMQASLLIGSLVPCAHRGVLEGCVLLSGGTIRASGHDLADSRHVSAPFLGVGARVGLEVPLGGVLSAGIHADVLAPITETILRVSGVAVWTSPPISGALGLTVGARFP
jgi:hypothetical protein